MALFSSLVARSPRRPRRARLAVEGLEARDVPTTTLFLDFGESFPAGGLQMTVAELRDTLTGPDLNDPFIGLSDNTTLTFAPLAGLVDFDYDGDGVANARDATALRDNTLALVRRFYDPFDVTVQVARAASLTDVTDALARNAGDASGQFDAYVFVAGVTPSAGTIPSGLLGIAALPDLGGSNVTDDTAVVFANNVFGLNTNNDASADTALALTAAHEAGHNLSLEHTTNTSLTNTAILTRSDVMQQFSRDSVRRDLHFFTRFPLPTAHNPGTQNSYDELALDPDIGLRAGRPAYVTGTGGHDRITLTRLNATQATVTVAPFRTADQIAGDLLAQSFSYTIDLGNGVRIEAGAGSDRVVIDGSLSATTVTVRGMAGDDHLVLQGNGAADGSYTPSVFMPTGLDGLPSHGGAARIGGVQVFFEEFEPASTVTADGIPTFTFNTPSTSDVLTVTSPAAGQTSISGTSAGTGLIPLTTTDVGQLTLNAGFGDVFAGSDQVTVQGVGTGTRMTVNTGAFDDTLTLELNGNVTVSNVTYDGGTGANALLVRGAHRTINRSEYTATGPAAGTVRLGSQFVIGNPPPTLTYANVQTLDDRLVYAPLNPFAPASRLVFYATAGSDSINVSDGTATAGPNTTIVQSVLGTFARLTFANRQHASVSGLGGIDTINLNSLPVNGLATLGLYGGAENDTLNVLATVAATPVTASGGDGDDTIVIGGLLNGLAAIAGGVTVSGDANGPVGDVLRVSDFALTAPQANYTYDLDADSVARPGRGGVDYFTVESLSLTAGRGNDTVNVWATAAGVSTTVNGGAGNDTIHVGSAGGSLDVIRGALTVAGQGGTADVVNFHDEGVSAGHNYTFNASSLTRTGSPFPINFGTAETVNLTAADFDDDLTFQAVPATALTVELGRGFNTVYSPDLDNAWVINGYVNGGGRAVLNSLATVGGVSRLAGGSQSDRFAFTSAGYIPSTLQGAGGINTLDYSALPANQGVTVNLATNRADLVGSSVVNIQFVIGGAGSDKLIGNGAGNVLVGRGGADVISGGGGRSILIGGDGSDAITGGGADDILIGGFLTSDTNVAALTAIFREWSRTDAAGTYARRLYNLRGTMPLDPGRLNGNFFLTVSTVDDDNVADQLTGGPGMDWFWADPAEVLDLMPGEERN
jgi:Ca2+-binding RTX toxin-like protein